MKSYFSRLANQSALRYRQVVNKSSPAASAEKNFSESAPLHREETIFAETISSKVDAPQKGKTESSSLQIISPANTPPVSKTKPSSKIEAKPPENVSIEFLDKTPTKNTESASLPTVQNSDSTTQAIYQAQRNQNEVSNESSSGESISFTSPDKFGGEQIVFKESGEQVISGENETTRVIDQKNTPQTQTNFQSTQNKFQPEVSTSVEVEPTGFAPNQPKYFKNTAASLEAGTADKSEIQQILLQEIYEWASGAPASSIDLPGAKENDSRQSNEVRVIASQSPEMTSFFGQEEAAQNTAQNPVPLKEQNFELSIGNISIIVEEPPPVQNTTIQNTVNDKATTAAPRESSRLSRYYL